MLELSVKNRVAIVTYRNAPVNTTNPEAYQAFSDMFHQINERRDVGAVILRTDGKGFMAGNDIHDLNLHTAQTHAAYQQKLINAFESITNCRYPVICAVQGYALGAGFAFPAAADFVIASDDAYFALPEVTLGVISGVGYALKMMPECLARYACMTGERISAQKMLEVGAIYQVVPRDQLMQAATKMAEKLASMPPETLVYMKEVLNQHCEHEYRRKFRLEDAYTSRLFGSSEKEEAVNAFLEKRKARFYD